MIRIKKRHIKKLALVVTKAGVRYTCGSFVAKVAFGVVGSAIASVAANASPAASAATVVVNNIGDDAIDRALDLIDAVT
jgi:hypothetical protein